MEMEKVRAGGARNSRQYKMSRNSFTNLLFEWSSKLGSEGRKKRSEHSVYLLINESCFHHD